ncbi:MAG: glucokinase [Pseudomonadota bacterium]|nr:glucokinase [Pseudomonadota bacterium]
MIGSAATEGRPWLLIDASLEGVLRFATASPSLRPRIEHAREIDIRGLPTFTDALQQFERESGHALRGLECALAIAGACSGETLSLVRSRWTITRAGLAAVFERPVTIINDVVSRAWATRSGLATMEPVRGSGTFGLNRPGRYVMVMVDEGVNAAIVDVDTQQHVSVLETEAGNIDFAPTNEREEKLATALKAGSPFVSWEKMLQLDRQDPVWSLACPELLIPERPRLLAGLLARYIVNLMHAYGAWQGVMLTGSRVGQILDSGGRPNFDTAFAARRHFGRLILGTPVWRVEQREAVLTGAAERLGRDYALEIRQAA